MSIYFLWLKFLTEENTNKYMWGIKRAECDISIWRNPLGGTECEGNGIEIKALKQEMEQ